VDHDATVSRGSDVSLGHGEAASLPFSCSSRSEHAIADGNGKQVGTFRSRSVSVRTKNALYVGYRTHLTRRSPEK
jgi:hypothetical protein